MDTVQREDEVEDQLRALYDGEEEDYTGEYSRCIGQLMPQSCSFVRREGGKEGTKGMRKE